MIGDTDIGKEFKNFDQIGVDLAAKAGYGPFGQIPLYVVFSMGGIGHRIADKSDYIQYNSYMIGGGVIFYPIRLIQIAGDIGYSYSSNSTSIQGISLKSGKDGFAGDISAALDLGKNNHGCLLGLRYFGAITKGSFDEFQKQSNISVFIRYAYRYKHAPGGED
jgi:hypothetical protein